MALGVLFSAGGSGGPGRRALLGSVLVHLVLLAGFVVSGAAELPARPELEVYQVSIVSAPPRVEAPEPALEMPTFTPEPEPIPPAPEPEPQPVEATDPPPARPEPEREPAPDEPAAERVAEPEQSSEPAANEQQSAGVAEAASKKDAEKSGQGLNVNIEGVPFPYPEYLENIILQVHRYFRWSGEPGLRAEVGFYIQRDGSVEGIRLLRGSGNVSFNFAVMGAIEQAGDRRAFGPLPQGFEQDRLWVSFYFEPQQ